MYILRLGLAVGMNRPILAIMKEGSSAPGILQSFVNHRFSYYSQLEDDLSKQMPVWFANASEQEILYGSHCHFLTRLCDDRNRLSPGRTYFLVDQTDLTAEDTGSPAHTIDLDLKGAIEFGLKRFNFDLELLSEAPPFYDFRFCNVCRATRDAAFVIVNVTQDTCPTVFLFAGLFVGLGINPLLLVNTPDKHGKEVTVPTLLQGLDYLPYKFFGELEEGLPQQLEDFLNTRRQPLIDRVLVDLPMEISEAPKGRVLIWSAMEAGPDHAVLIEKHAEEMFSAGFPRMLAYIYVGPNADILQAISEYLDEALFFALPFAGRYSVDLSKSRSFDDDRAVQKAVLNGFQVEALGEIHTTLEKSARRLDSPYKAIGLQHETIKASAKMHSSLANYVSWIDTKLISSLPENAYLMTQLFVQTKEPGTFASSLAQQLRSAHPMQSSIVRIANDISDDPSTREFWESRLSRRQSCG